MENRRDVSARKVNLFHRLAQVLVNRGLTPNQISVASSVFALFSGMMFYLVSKGNEPRILFLILAILGIQLRLICNLIDGLMAVEGGLKTKSGEIFNDVPDRFSDVFIIVGAGVLANAESLAWIAALLAVLTAYIRTLGAALTGKHDFIGPMAKQHRMFLITLGCVGSIFEILFSAELGQVMKIAIILVAIGSLLTCLRRLVRLYKNLEQV